MPLAKLGATKHSDPRTRLHLAPPWQIVFIGIIVFNYPESLSSQPGFRGAQRDPPCPPCTHALSWASAALAALSVPGAPESFRSLCPPPPPSAAFGSLCPPLPPSAAFPVFLQHGLWDLCREDSTPLWGPDPVLCHWLLPVAPSVPCAGQRRSQGCLSHRARPSPLWCPPCRCNLHAPGPGSLCAASQGQAKHAGGQSKRSQVRDQPET